MTKTKAKRAITKASTSKTSATRTSTPKSDDNPLLVLGFDEQQKPCGARFVGDKPDLVAKAAELMGLEVYKVSSPGCRRCSQEAAHRAALRQRPRVRAERAANALQRSHCRAGGRTAAGRGRRRTTTRPAPRSPAACRAAGTRSRLAISSSRKRASPTGGGRRSCSTAKTTCSRCGFATTRGSRSSFGTAARSR